MGGGGGGGGGGRHSGAGIRWKEAVKSLLEQLLKTLEDSLLHLEAISDSARELEKSAGCWGQRRATGCQPTALCG